MARNNTIKIKNSDLFKRIFFKDTHDSDEREFIKKALKSLEETVELNVNARDKHLRLFVEAKRNGLFRGEPQYHLLIYPEEGKKIIGFSLSGKLEYVCQVELLSDTLSPLTFMYDYRRKRYTCEIMLHNPHDKRKR
jgi:hypothetical protein